MRRVFTASTVKNKDPLIRKALEAFKGPLIPETTQDYLERIALCEKIGSVRYMRGDIPGSIQSYLEALRLTETQRPEFYTARVRLFVSVAYASIELREFEQASKYLEEAYNAVKNYYPSQKNLTAIIHLNNGNLLREQGDYSRAIDSYNHSKSHGKDDVKHTMRTLFEIANAYTSEYLVSESAEKLQQARDAINQALEISNQISSPDQLGLRVLWASSMIATLSSDFALADKELATSQRLCQVMKNDSLLAESNVFMGRLKIEEAKIEEALQLLVEAHQKIASAYGENSRQAMETLFYIGNSHFRLGNFRRAKDFYTKVAEIQRKNYPNLNHPGLARLHNAMCDVEHMENNLDKAIEEGLKAEKIWKNVGTPGMKGRALTLGVLGALYSKAGKLTLALPVYEESFQLRERIFGFGSHWTVQALEELGKVYARLAQHDSATVCFEKILTCDAWKGTDFYDTVLENYSVSLWYLEKYDRSVEAFLQSFERKLEAAQNNPSISLKNMYLSLRRLADLCAARSLDCAESLFVRILNFFQGDPIYIREYIETNNIFAGWCAPTQPKKAFQLFVASQAIATKEFGPSSTLAIQTISCLTELRKISPSVFNSSPLANPSSTSIPITPTLLSLTSSSSSSSSSSLSSLLSSSSSLSSLPSSSFLQSNLITSTSSSSSRPLTSSTPSKSTPTSFSASIPTSPSSPSPSPSPSPSSTSPLPSGRINFSNNTPSSSPSTTNSINLVDSQEEDDSEEKAQFEELLRKANLLSVREQLIQDGATLRTLCHLTADDLIEYGIPKLRARSALVQLIEELEAMGFFKKRRTM